MDSYTRRIPFPYSFGSRVGYYSVRCYLAPISVSPISKALGILRIAINPLTIQARPHNSTIRLLFRCSHRSRRLACSIELLSRLVLRKARPTCKPTFQRLAFSQFNTIRTIHALFVLKLLHNISAFLSQSGLGAVFEFRA